jgi:hypothetical protein
MRTEFKLQDGETTTLQAVEPIIGITGEGKNTYLWIGNNGDYNKGCYATLSGQKTLEKFALNILKSLKITTMTTNNTGSDD